MNSSFASAGQFPAKILRMKGLAEQVKRQTIPPIHLQFIPTNRCNLNCRFCSCQKRDFNKEMTLAKAREILWQFGKLGMQCMTITGGGEPCLWSPLSEFLLCAASDDISVGLVTNGTKLSYVTEDALKTLKWCRISCSDEANRIDAFRTVIDRVPGVDWAFSYVVTSTPNADNFIEHVRFAREHNFTHMRVVANIIDLDHAADFSEFKAHAANEARELIIIWQDRQTFTRGMSSCLISLLKPVIGPDGEIYPCCGAQYARANMDLDLAQEMRMGDISRAYRIWAEQKYFDGSKCDRCYYGAYNELLGMIQEPLMHELFV